MGDEQHLTPPRDGLFEVPDDLGNHGTVEVGVPVDGTEGIRGIEKAEFVLDRPLNEVLGRLSEENLGAAPGDLVSVSSKRAGLPGASQGVKIKVSHYRNRKICLERSLAAARIAAPATTPSRKLLDRDASQADTIRRQGPGAPNAL
ncbi:hypothetical protein [Methylobacterium sp. Leaf94]|uniref:hypothetical protein n=1 Tax=Methylobacterium sp. Leaf94 TaxID=1736250 RepID=UPI0012E363F6|nr:hypothetical protein [Methylobacterium sp. Leaf94]